MQLLFDYTAKTLEKFFIIRSSSWHKEMDNFFKKIQAPAIGYIVQCLLFRNRYIDIWEPKVTKFLKTTKGKLFIDIGACYGRLSLLLADNYEKILTVEPNPSNMETIIGNITYAHIKKIIPVKVAISDEMGSFGMKTFFRDDGTRFVNEKEKADIIVPTVTLASLLQNQYADLIKVDAEGAEWKVLEGAIPVLKQIKSWLVELHDPNRKRELEQWFSANNYSISWLDSNHIFALMNQN